MASYYLCHSFNFLFFWEFFFMLYGSMIFDWLQSGLSLPASSVFPGFFPSSAEAGALQCVLQDGWVHHGSLSRSGPGWMLDIHFICEKRVVLSCLVCAAEIWVFPNISITHTYTPLVLVSTISGKYVYCWYGYFNTIRAPPRFTLELQWWNIIQLYFYYLQF